MNKDLILSKIEEILKADYSNNIIIPNVQVEIPNNSAILSFDIILEFDIQLEDYNDLFIHCIFKFDKTDYYYALSLMTKEMDLCEACLDGIFLSSNSNIFEVASVCKLLNIYQDLNLYSKKFVLQLKDILSELGDCTW